MRKIALIIVVLFTAGGTLARSLPAETSLSTLMLDQKDPLFYDQGVIPQGQSSSLCGPTSAVNWLQLQNTSQPYSKKDLVEFVRTVGEDLRSQHININNGLIEIDLVRFLEVLNQHLGVQKKYVVKGRYYNGQGFSEQDVWNDQVQIWLLNYSEIPRSIFPGPRRGMPGRPGRDIPLPDDMMGDRPLARGNHFVLKVAADKEKNLIAVIDPESPGRYTFLRVSFTPQAVYIKGVSAQDLSAFAFGVPLQWSVLSLLEERN